MCCNREALCCNRSSTRCKLLCALQSFFRAELRAIKDKHVQQDQKMDKATAQLQQIEELLCYALMIPKRTCPLDPAGPSVATEEPTVDPEPPVATTPQPVSSPSKKRKSIFFLCLFILFSFQFHGFNV